MPEDHEVTRLLTALERGDPKVKEQLWNLVYPNLHTIAERQMKGDRFNQTLQPAALVNEGYLKMTGKAAGTDWQGRTHFFATAANVMRHILVDRARARNAKKRGGEMQRVTLDAAESKLTDDGEVDVLALEDALKALGRRSLRQARIVEMRFFAGLDVEETAKAIGVSPRTVKSEWAEAREFLRKRLGSAL